MEPIRVTKPPASAFNKGRRISDLLQSQIEHFQHLEQKHRLQLNPAMTGDLHTEGGAARYIAHATQAIRQRALAAKAAPKLVSMPGRKTVVRPAKVGQVKKDQGLSLAAAAEPGRGPATQKKGKKKRKEP